MAVHFVSYDLKKPGQNYPSLIRALSAVGERILLSAWIVNVAQSASALRDVLLTHVDYNDDVVVIEIRPNDYDWATHARVTNPGVALLMQLRP